jgi:predicted PurR-regulated permease PerM
MVESAQQSRAGRSALSMHPLDRIRQSRELLILSALGLFVLGYVLIHVSHILSPFVVAAIFAYVLHPVVGWLQRRTGLPRALVIAVLYIFLIGFLVIVGFLVVPALIDQVRALVNLLPAVIESAEQQLQQRPQIRIGELVVDTEALLKRLDVAAQALAERFSREAVPLLLTTVEVLIKTFVFLIASFYFLLQGGSLVARIRLLAPRRYQRAIGRILSQVNLTFGAYVRAQFILFLIMASATYVALTVLQVKYALALAIATGLLELIPFIGPWTAGTIAVIVALAQGSAPFGWSPLQLALVVALVYFTLRMLEDHFVIPQLVGHFVRLHPVVVIFGVLAGASIAGILGLLLAVPILAALKIVFMSVVEELRHPLPREVILIRGQDALDNLAERIADPSRRDIVLLIEPGTVTWDDLPRIQAVHQIAGEHDVQLQVVTPDPGAASIVTAVGLPLVTKAPVEWRQEATLVPDVRSAPRPAERVAQPRAGVEIDGGVQPVGSAVQVEREVRHGGDRD